MKKTSFFIFCSISLSGCLSSMDAQLTKGNEKSDTPIINTLEMYEEFLKGNPRVVDKQCPYSGKKPGFWSGYGHCGAQGGLLFPISFTICLPVCSIYYSRYNDYSDLMVPEVNRECVLDNSSDECILYEREHPRPDTKVDYFNYKKYLPSGYKVYSDEDFLKLVDFYHHHSDYTRKLKCDSNGQCEAEPGRVDCEKLTSFECKQRKTEDRITYVNDLESKLQWYIKEGLEEEKKQEEEYERLAEEQQKAEEERQKIEAEKEKAYEACMKKLNKKLNDCSNNHKIGCRTLIDGAVISIASNGVVVEDLFDGTKFIYTSKKYTKGSNVPRAYYPKSGIYYEYVGTYDYVNTMGSYKRVPAYKGINLALPDCDSYKK